jgi:hypothetical protein
MTRTELVRKTFIFTVTLKKKYIFFFVVLAFSRSLTKRAGSGSGSVSQRHAWIRIRTKMSRMWNTPLQKQKFQQQEKIKL